MMWLTWRQFRAQAIVAAAVLAAVAIALAVTGPHLAGLYASSGLAACPAHGNCERLITAFMDQVKGSTPDGLLFALCIGLLLAAPGLIGVFWGAPLVTREIEAGTFRLAWNQSVTRAHWLAVKLSLIGLASMAATGLLSLMVSWWASPLDRVTGLSAGRDGTPGFDRFAPVLFASRGITPIAYAAFAFALGVTVGVLIRRTVPAMAVTLAVFAADRYATLGPSALHPPVARCHGV
jgi:ABC-2 family transporter protein